MSIALPTPMRGTFGRLVGPAIGLGVLLVLWIVGGRAGWLDGMLVTPTEATRPIWGSTSELYRRATLATLGSALRGLIVGGGLAFVAALLATGVPALRRPISRLATIANAAPWVAVAPCLLVVLGRERGPSAVAALAVFFFVFVSTSVGLGAAPAATHDVLTALGAGRAIRLRVVQLPACWPSVVDGMKLAAPAAVAGSIFGEWYGAERGLGVVLIGAMQSGRAERLWAASLLSAASGLAAYGVLAVAHRALTRRYGSTVTAAPERTHAARPLGSRIVVEVATAVAVAAGLVAVWWAWIEAADVSPLVVPRPSRVWSNLVDSPGDYVAATGSTLLTAAIALAIGIAVGVGAAVAASRAPLLAGIAVPVVVVLAATPLVALLPLFARLLGYRPATVRVLSSAMVFFPVFVYTRSGLSAASTSTRDALRALGAPIGRRLRLLDLPAAVPHVATGCRIAAGTAVIASVVGESLIGRTGLGVEFSRAYRQLELPRAFGAAIVIVVVSVLVFALAGAVEQAVHARWR